jgi:hypothetical protein
MGVIDFPFWLCWQFSILNVDFCFNDEKINSLLTAIPEKLSIFTSIFIFNNLKRLVP